MKKSPWIWDCYRWGCMSPSQVRLRGVAIDHIYEMLLILNHMLLSSFKGPLPIRHTFLTVSAQALCLCWDIVTFSLIPAGFYPQHSPFWRKAGFVLAAKFFRAVSYTFLYQLSISAVLSYVYYFEKQNKASICGQSVYLHLKMRPVQDSRFAAF